MYSETTMVAKQCRLREWAAQIRDCQSRPAGMSVVEWCACHDITKANYYYRLPWSPDLPANCRKPDKEEVK